MTKPRASDKARQNQRALCGVARRFFAGEARLPRLFGALHVAHGRAQPKSAPVSACATLKIRGRAVKGAATRANLCHARLWMLPSLTLQPIGLVHSPFRERLEAPRQPTVAEGLRGTIELFPVSGIEHALEDLSSFRFIWVLFWFHHNQGFRPKVLPPRSAERRGVFATRSPYRPNPIGLSAVELLGIEGRVLSIANLDILDGTPVLDIKPYVPYTDSIPEATSGWLESAARPRDPLPDHEVAFSERALLQLSFLETRGTVIRPQVEEVLRLGPQPHPYRRIKAKGPGWVLAYKAWRLNFGVEGRRLLVTEVESGYRPSQLFRAESSSDAPELALHREFVAAFP